MVFVWIVEAVVTCTNIPVLTPVGYCIKYILPLGAHVLEPGTLALNKYLDSYLICCLAYGIKTDLYFVPCSNG